MDLLTNKWNFVPPFSLEPSKKEPLEQFLNKFLPTTMLTLEGLELSTSKKVISETKLKVSQENYTEVVLEKNSQKNRFMQWFVLWEWERQAKSPSTAGKTQMQNHPKMTKTQINQLHQLLSKTTITLHRAHSLKNGANLQLLLLVHTWDFLESGALTTESPNLRLGLKKNWRIRDALTAIRFAKPASPKLGELLLKTLLDLSFQSVEDSRVWDLLLLPTGLDAKKPEDAEHP